ncbi:lonely Cys domain-containing protein [Streptomyces sp. NPDC013433]|uniref:lonely Cys domain-containing protein n=1 Tax=Streptomyces sp. NPDC013433 TaxID=3155604 RepID=UPI0034522FE1
MADHDTLSDPVRWALLVATGENLVTASEDGAYNSREAYAQLGASLRSLSTELRAGAATVAASLPAQVRDSYLRTVKSLTDDGSDGIPEMVRHLENIAQGRVRISMEIREMKLNVYAEALRLLAEVSFYLALASFTGGTSLMAIAAMRARFVLRVLIATQVLTHRVVPLIGAPLEALDEALQGLMVRLYHIATAPAGRAPSGVDWRAVGQDAVFGAFAGLFGGLIGSATHGAVESLATKTFKDRTALTLPLRSLNEGVTEGFAESLAESVSMGVLFGAWVAPSVLTGLQAGASGFFAEAVMGSALLAGKGLHKFLFAPPTTTAGARGAAEPGTDTGAVQQPDVVNSLSALPPLPDSPGAGLLPTVSTPPPALPYTPPPAGPPSTYNTASSAVTPAAVAPASPGTEPVILPGTEPVLMPGAEPAPESATVPVTREPLPSPEPPSSPGLSSPGPETVPPTTSTPGSLPLSAAEPQPQATSYPPTPPAPRALPEPDPAAVPGGTPADPSGAAAGQSVPGSARDGLTAPGPAPTRGDPAVPGPTPPARDDLTADGIESILGNGSASTTVAEPAVPPAPGYGTPAPEHQAPVTDQQSSAPQHGASVTRHQAPVTQFGTPAPGHQPPVTDQLGPVTDRQSADGAGVPGDGPAHGDADTERRAPDAYRPPSVAGEPEATDALHATAGNDAPETVSAGTPTAGRPAGGDVPETAHTPRTAHQTPGVSTESETAGAEAGRPAGAGRPAEHTPHPLDTPRTEAAGPAPDGNTGRRSDQETPTPVAASPEGDHRAEPATPSALPGPVPGAAEPARPAERQRTTHARAAALTETGTDRVPADDPGRPEGLSPSGADTPRPETDTPRSTAPGTTRTATEATASATDAPRAGTDTSQTAGTGPGTVRTESAGFSSPAPTTPGERLATDSPRSERLLPGDPTATTHVTRMSGNGRLTSAEDDAAASADPAARAGGSTADDAVPRTGWSNSGNGLDYSRRMPPRTGRSNGGNGLDHSRRMPPRSSRNRIVPPSGRDFVGDLLAVGAGQDAERPWIADAVRVLEGLAPPTPRLSGSFRLWMPSVTRQVLSLPESDHVNGTADYREVLETVREASATGRAGSLTDLAVVALRRAGALSDATLVRDAAGGKVTGRSWSGRLAGGEVDLTEVSRVRYDAGVWTEEPGSREPAPWTGPAGRRVALLEAGISLQQQRYGLETRVTLDLGGRDRWVDTAVLAELIRQDDQAFPPDAELLLAIPEAGGQGAVLTRPLADSLNRHVWSPTAGLRLTHGDDPTAPPYLALATADSRRIPWGQWLHTPPRPGPLPESRKQNRMRLMDPATGRSEEVPYGALRIYHMVTGAGSHQPHGLASHSPEEWAVRESDLPTLHRHERYYVYNPVDQVPVAARPAPWAKAVAAGVPVFVFAAHGTRFGTVSWALTDGRVMHGDTTSAAEYLRQCPDLLDLNRQAPDGHQALVFLQVCEQRPVSARAADPLAEPGPGQVFSTALGHRVVASPTVMGVFSLKEQTSPSRLPFLWAGFDGSLPQMRILAPEPDDTGLDTLAPALGFPPGPRTPQDRAVVRRLVRALRLTFALKEEDTVVPERDPELTAGIAALEALRRDDPVLGRFGPFTLDFLDHATDAHARQRGRTDERDRTELHRDLLRSAHRWWKQSHEKSRGPNRSSGPTKVTAFLPMPDAYRTAAWWDTNGGDLLVRDILRPGTGTPAAGGDQDTAGVTAEDRARAFWSLVRATNAVHRAATAATAGKTPDHSGRHDGLKPLIDRVLRLPEDTPVDGTARDLLHTRVAQALAHGYPDTDPAAWAAWDLELAGVLDASEEIRTAEAQHVGRSLTGTRVKALQTDGFATEATPLPTLQPPWDSSSFTLWEVGEIGPDTVRVAIPGGHRETSHDALAHLIHTHLERRGDLRRHLVVIAPAADERAALRLNRTIADITGRQTFIEPDGSQLRPNGSGSGHLIVARPGDQAATSADWRSAWPHRPHFDPVETSRPLVRPRPAGPDAEGRAFDLRVLSTGETWTHDLTVRVAFAPGPVPEVERDVLWQRAVDGVQNLFNTPTRTVSGRRLHVTLERVGPDGDAHLTVDLTGPDGAPPMNRKLWHTDATAQELAVRVGQQLGIDNAGAWSPDLQDIPLNDFYAHRLLTVDAILRPEGAPSALAAPPTANSTTYSPSGSPPDTGPDTDTGADSDSDSDSDSDVDAASAAEAFDVGDLFTVVDPEADAVATALVFEGAGTDADRPWIASAVRTLADLSPHGPEDILARVEDAMRRVLCLPEGTALDAIDHQQALVAVWRAAAADRADSLAELAAYFLGLVGALSEDTLVRDTGGRLTGRSWSGRLTDGTVLDPATVSRGVRDETTGGWAETPGSRGPAPWANLPVAVLEADGDESGLTLHLAGHDRRVDGAVLAELLRHDPHFPQDAELVLAIPQAGALGAVLPRTLSRHLDRNVWAPTTGILLFRSGGAGSPAHLALAVPDPAREPAGQWLLTRPDQALALPETDERAGQWLTDSATGAREWVPDSALLTYTMTTGTDHDRAGHESTGRATFTPAEWARHGQLTPYVSILQDHYVFDPALDRLVAVLPSAPWAEARAAGEEVYTFGAHGTRFGVITWRLLDGREMRGTTADAAKYVTRRPSLTALNQRARDGKALIFLESCEQSPLPPRGTADPLRVPGPGQIFANTSGHPTVANPTSSGFFASDDLNISGESEHHPVILAGFDGSLTERALCVPEPDDDELDALAPAFRFPHGPYTPQDRAQVLRLVRALRITFPLTTRKAPPPERDTELAAGIGALEALRREDPLLDEYGPFTLDFLDHATDIYARRHGRTGDQDRTQLRRDLLRSADRWWKQSHREPGGPTPPSLTHLTTFLPMPDAAGTAAWWTANGADDLVHRILPHTPGTPADDGAQHPADDAAASNRARAFWSLVRAGDAITRAAATEETKSGSSRGPGADGTDELARQVLHLPPGTPVDQTIRDLLHVRVAQALAAGHPDTDPAAWAAQDLLLRGVLDAAGPIHHARTRDRVGRCLTGPHVRNLVTATFSVGTSPLQQPAPWNKSSVIVWEVGDILSDTVRVGTFNGMRETAQHALAHLIYADLEQEGDLSQDIVLVGPVVSEEGAVRLRQAVADVTGRVTHLSSAGSALRPNTDGRHTIEITSSSGFWQAALPHRPHFDPLGTGRQLFPSRTVGPDAYGRTFDVRRLSARYDSIRELTVRVKLLTDASPDPTPEADEVWQRALAGTEKLFNAARHLFPDQDRLYVTLERTGPGEDAHLEVRLASPDGGPPTSRHLWRTDTAPEELAVQIGRQLGLGDHTTWQPGPDGRLTGDDIKRLDDLTRPDRTGAPQPVTNHAPAILQNPNSATDQGVEGSDGDRDTGAGRADGPGPQDSTGPTDGHGPTSSGAVTDSAAPDDAAPWADSTWQTGGEAPDEAPLRLRGGAAHSDSDSDAGSLPSEADLNTWSDDEDDDGADPDTGVGPTADTWVTAVAGALILGGAGTGVDRQWIASAVRTLADLSPHGPVPQERIEGAMRQVLCLPADTALTPADHQQALQAVRDAVNARRDGSLAELAAYFLTRAGALAERTLVHDTHGKVIGRSWSGRLTGGTLLDPATVSRGTHDESTGQWAETPGSRGPAPWTNRPVAVLEADGDASRLTVNLAGRDRRVDATVLAELLRHDTDVFPGHTELLLAVTGPDGAGTALPRTLARNLDRPVWSPTAGLETAGDDGPGKPLHLAFTGGDSRETPPRRWLYTPPGPARQPEDDPWAGQWLTDPVTGVQEWVPDSALRTYTVVPGADHEPHGHESAGIASFDPQDWAGREPEMRQLTAFQDFHFVDPAAFVPVASRRVPWADALKDGIPLYIFALHGDPHGRLSWNLRDGRTMHGDAWQAGAQVRRHQGLADMDARAPRGQKAHVLLAACHAGGPPAGTLDPLETPGPAQDFANGSERRTYASSTPPGTSVESPADEEAPSVGFAFADAEFDGSLRGWQRYDPEPTNAELVTLSRALGVEPVSAASVGPVPPALRLVRALRREFGPLAERDTELMAGIGALERLRREDPVLSGTGAFTLGFLDEAAHAYARQSGRTADTDPVALRRDLLHSARRWWEMSQRTPGRQPRLTSYLPMPGAWEASQQWADGGDPLARDILLRSPSPDGTAAPLSEADRGRAFWSLARAGTAVAEAAQTHGLDRLARRVLHLGPDAETAPDVLHTLRIRVAQAYAADYPDTDGPAAWEARDLEHRGVLDAASDVHAGGQTLGRSLAGTVTADLEISGFRIGAPDSPRQPEDAPWQGEEVTIVEVAGVEADTVTVRHPGGELKATHEALAQLLAADLRREGDTTTRIVLVGPVSNRHGAERLVQAVADVTGRKAYVEPSGSALLPGPDGRHVITVAPGTTPTPDTDPATANWLHKLPHRPHFEPLRTTRRLFPPRTVGPASDARTGYTPGFDIRRLPLEDTGVREATVLVEFTPADTDIPEAEQEALWNRAVDGVEELFNRSPHRFPDGARLHVTLERVGPGQGAHLKVKPTGPQQTRAADQWTWPTDATPRDLAARIGLQLGLGDGTTWQPGPDGITPADLDRLQQLIDRSPAHQPSEDSTGPQTDPEPADGRGPSDGWADTGSAAPEDHTAPIVIISAYSPHPPADTPPSTGSDTVVPPLLGLRGGAGQDDDASTDTDTDSDSEADEEFFDALSDVASDDEADPRTGDEPDPDPWVDAVVRDIGPIGMDDRRVASAVRALRGALPPGAVSDDGAPGIEAVDGATRRVLCLPDDAALEPSDYRAAFAAVRRAVATGRADSLTQLAAAYLERSGALLERTLVRDGAGSIAGRSWTWELNRAIDLTVVSRARPNGAAGWRMRDGTLGPAPWSDRPVRLLAADGDATSVKVTLADGLIRRVDGAVLAELLRHDPAFPQGAELVLAVPEAGALDAVLPRTLSRELDRNVWAPTVLRAFRPRTPRSRAHLCLAVADPEREPQGQWLLTRPDHADPLPGTDDENRQWLTDPETGVGAWVPDSALHTYTIVSGTDHEPTGLASFSPVEWAAFEKSDPHLPGYREYHLEDPALYRPVAVRPTPWAGAVAAGMPVFVFSAHGSPRGIVWHVRGGRNRSLRGSALSAGRWLLRQQSLAALDRRAPQHTKALILVSSCTQSPLPHGPVDPLHTPGPGQLIANGADHRVVVSPRITGAALSKVAPSQRHPFVHAGFDGSLEGMRICDPEPDDGALDALAPAFGFAPDSYTPPRDRATVLRLVRALRITLPPTDWEAPPPERDTVLAAGIGALEALRREDPVLGRFGPFTLDFLDHATDAYAGRHGRTAGGDRAELRRDLLNSAARWRSQSHAMPGDPRGITAFLDMPDASRAAEDWEAKEKEVERRAAEGENPDELSMVRRILPRNGTPAGDEGPAADAETDRARAFWSLVHARSAITRAGEAVTGAGETAAAPGRTNGVDQVARQVLHLYPGTPVDHDIRQRLRTRVAQALAQGYPDTDPAAWAAQHLEDRGVLALAAEIRTGGTWRGRSLAVEGVWDLVTSGIAVGTRPQSVAPVPWRRSFTVWEVVDIELDTVYVEIPGNLQKTSHQALAHLIRADLERRNSTEPEIVLVGSVTSEEGALRLGRTVADITGRITHIEPGGSELRKSRSGRGVIHVRPEDAAATSAHWQTTLPHRPHFDPLGAGRLLTSDRTVAPDKYGRGFLVHHLRDPWDGVYDLTVRVRLEPGAVPDAEREAVWDRAVQGVGELFNAPPHHRFPRGERLHVTLRRVTEPGEGADLRVELAGRDDRWETGRRMWRTDATPAELAVQIGRQLGLGGDDTAWQPDPDDRLTRADMELLGDRAGVEPPDGTDVPRSVQERSARFAPDPDSEARRDAGGPDGGRDTGTGTGPTDTPWRADGTGSTDGTGPEYGPRPSSGGAVTDSASPEDHTTTVVIVGPDDATPWTDTTRHTDGEVSDGAPLWPHGGAGDSESDAGSPVSGADPGTGVGPAADTWAAAVAEDLINGGAGTANGTGHPVAVSPTRSGHSTIFPWTASQPLRYAPRVHARFDGSPEERRVLAPEPDDAELDALAPGFGVDTDPGDPLRHRAAVLPLVRALRIVFPLRNGEDRPPEQDKDRAAGIGALDRLRREDPVLGRFGAFTLDFLDHATDAYARRHGRTDERDRVELCQDLLRSAERWWKQSHEETHDDPSRSPGPTNLTAFLHMPDVYHTAAWWTANGADALVRRIVDPNRRTQPGDGGREPAGAADRARAFWSLVRAGNAVVRAAAATATGTTDGVDDVARRVLHLPPHTPVDQDVHRLLRIRVAQALAHGYPDTDPAAWAAWDLERRGLLDTAGPVRAVGTRREVGRSLVGTDAQDLITDMFSIGTSDVRWEQAPWRRAVTVWEVGAISPDTVRVNAHDGPLETSHRALAHLIRADLEQHGDNARDIVLVGPAADEAGALRLRRALADITGRVAYVDPAGSALLPVDGGGHTVNVGPLFAGWRVTLPDRPHFDPVEVGRRLFPPLTVGPDQYGSGFDLRLLETERDTVRDLTVRVRLSPVAPDREREADGVWRRAVAGTEELFNAARHLLPDRTRLHVTVERAGPDEDAHLDVRLAPPDVSGGTSRHLWRTDATPAELAVRIGRQLGLGGDRLWQPGRNGRLTRADLDRLATLASAVPAGTTTPGTAAP